MTEATKSQPPQQVTQTKRGATPSLQTDAVVAPGAPRGTPHEGGPDLTSPMHAAPARDALGRLTRAGMEQAIRRGGSVQYQDRLVTNPGELPDEAELVKGDEAQTQALLDSYDQQIAHVQQQRAKLLAQQEQDRQRLAATDTPKQPTPRQPETPAPTPAPPRPGGPVPPGEGDDEGDDGKGKARKAGK